MLDYSPRTMKRNSILNSRRMLLYGFLSILCFARTFESAPLDSGSDSARHESTGTLSDLPLKKGQDEEVGNPEVLAWDAWLLVSGQSDSQASGDLDSASLLRRLTPIQRSIFVAPRVTDCAEGYQDDKMNRCVKDVRINEQAHNRFLIERLIAKYKPKPQAAASSSSSSSLSSSSSIPSGPLQLNIPISITAPVKSEPQESEIQEAEKPPPPVEPLKIIAGDLAASNPNAGHQDAIVTVYELSDDQREDEHTFFLGNKSTEIIDKIDESSQTRLDHVVPVAEFIEDSSSNLSGVVDYKISTKETFNRTSAKVEDVEDVEEMPNKIRDRGSPKETEVSPTLVLLLSPTKVPSIPDDDLVVAHNSSFGQVLIKTENVTENVTAKQIIRVNVPDDVSLSPDEDVEESTTEHRSGDFDNGEEKDNIEDTEEPSTETYDDEAYEESTEIEDEILKHSEAGMTVTIPESVRPVTVETRTENDDKETTGSSEISSEVSINGDFVRETTLVDFNISKASNFTGTTSPKIAETTTSTLNAPKGIEVVETIQNPSITITNNKRDGSQTSEAKNEETHSEDHKKTEVERKVEKAPELVFPVRPIEALFEEESKIEPSSTEKFESAETMVAASTNEAGQIISREPPKFDIAASSSSKKRGGHPFKFDDTVSTSTTKVPSTFPNVEGIYDYEPVQRDYPRRPGNGVPEDDSLPVIRTIDEQKYNSEREEEDHSFFNSQQQQQQQQDYVRFPSYDRHGRPNFVRFPSEEVNSIHSPNDYKDRNRRPYGQQYQAANYGRVTQTTKSLPEHEIRQKQSYWWVPPNWRNDQQQQQQPVNPQRSRSGSVDQRARDRAPMLLRFWTRMPLVRDPSLNFQQHPTHPTMFASSRSDSHVPSRRVNYYKEMSSRDLSRAFTRKALSSAIGG